MGLPHCQAAVLGAPVRRWGLLRSFSKIKRQDWTWPWNLLVERRPEEPTPIDWQVQGGPRGLRLYQQEGDPIAASGLAVWPSARVLAEYLLQHEDLEGRSVLELGAGTGAVGLALAGKASRVLLSDHLLDERGPPTYALDGSLEEDALLQERGRFPCGGVRGESPRQLKLLEQNLELNSDILAGADVRIQELDFRDGSAAASAFRTHGPFDFIIGSDIGYNREVHGSLTSCLAILNKLHTASEAAHARTLIAQECRLATCDESLVAHLAEVELSAEEVHRKGNVAVLLIECM